MPVLLRPDGAVQVGWDPRRAVLVRPPRGLAAAELARLLRSMCSPTPLSELLVESLRCSGARIAHSSQPHAAVSGDDVDLVVLSDYLVADPRLVRDLHEQGVAHLPVRVRDGVGLVGPLVIPGVTSCLSCADLHRRDRDAAWPVICAQLRDTVGVADRATVLATGALALSQVNRVIAAVRGQPAASDPAPPQTLNATLEFDLQAGAIVARRWDRHPLCSC